MKILILTTSIGDNAPGKVFLSYINMVKELGYEVDVVSTKNVSNISSDIVHRSYIHPRLRKLSIITFGVDVFDLWLAKRSAYLYLKDYSHIISMVSAHHFFPLYMGYLLKKIKKSTKWIVYSVDAIPAPKGWDIGQLYTDGLVRMINKYLGIADGLYFSNQEMLQYQKNLLDFEFLGRSGVLYTVPNAQYREYEYKEEESFNLMYMGGIYQARKVDELLKGFDIFQKNVSNTKLFFIGTNREAVNTTGLSEDAIKKIIFVDYVSDLTFYYEISNVLIDIDADIDNDVFISSKFFTYVSVNRYILSITRCESPVRKFLSENSVESVFTADIDKISIFNAIYAIYKENYTDNIFRYRFSTINKVVHPDMYDILCGLGK